MRWSGSPWPGSPWPGRLLFVRAVLCANAQLHVVANGYISYAKRVFCAHLLVVVAAAAAAAAAIVAVAAAANGYISSTQSDVPHLILVQMAQKVEIGFGATFEVEFRKGCGNVGSALS